VQLLCRRTTALLAFVWLASACVPADRKDELSSIPTGGPATVYDVHTGLVDSGDAVTLEGVVAVLPRTPADDFFVVQDARGGEYAGLEVHLHHALPGLEVVPGDVLTVTGVLSSRNGRLRLMVDDEGAIVHTGTTTVAPTVVGPVADWEPYNGVLVHPGETTLLDCGVLAGSIQTDRDLLLDLSHLPSAVVGTGVVDTGLAGVVRGADAVWSLVPRTADELGNAPTEGCPTTVFEARSAGHGGRLVLPGVVVTGVQPDGTRAFVQDPGGGVGSGLELAGDGLAVAVGETVMVAGLLDSSGGPWVLQVAATGDVDSEDGVVVDVLELPASEERDGALVEVKALTVTGSEAVGRRTTAEGVELVDVLLDDETLPPEGEWWVRGLLRVDDRTDPVSVQLLPRDAGDWAVVE